MVISAPERYVEIAIPGRPPVLIFRGDMACDAAWFCLQKGIELEEDAFISKNKWWQYWFAVMNLFEGTIPVIGRERAGKSLVASWIAMMRKKLFGIPTVANFYLKEGVSPSEIKNLQLDVAVKNALVTINQGFQENRLEAIQFGELMLKKIEYEFNAIFNDDQINKLVKQIYSIYNLPLTYTEEVREKIKVVRLKEIEQDTLEMIEGFGEYEHIDFKTDYQEEIDKLYSIAEDEKNLSRDEMKEREKSLKLCNKTILVDEAKEIIGRQWTKLCQSLGMLNRLHGHLHNLAFYISQDQIDFSVRECWERRTHKITASKDDREEYPCFYVFQHRESGFTRTLKLKPTEWLHLWNSTNKRGLGVKVKLKNI